MALAIQWYLDDIQIFIIYLNISMVLNKILIRWFWVDVTTKAPKFEQKNDDISLVLEALINWMSDFEGFGFTASKRLKREKAFWGISKDLSIQNSYFRQFLMNTQGVLITHWHAKRTYDRISVYTGNDMADGRRNPTML